MQDEVDRGLRVIRLLVMELESFHTYNPTLPEGHHAPI